jgi:phosphatidylserine decarboxylase
VQTWDYAPGTVRLDKGDEMGRFNMGSTIILLFGPEAVEWSPALHPGAIMRVGRAMGRLPAKPAMRS